MRNPLTRSVEQVVIIMLRIIKIIAIVIAKGIFIRDYNKIRKYPTQTLEEFKLANFMLRGIIGTTKIAEIINRDHSLFIKYNKIKCIYHRKQNINMSFINKKFRKKLKLNFVFSLNI